MASQGTFVCVCVFAAARGRNGVKEERGGGERGKGREEQSREEGWKRRLRRKAGEEGEVSKAEGNLLQYTKGVTKCREKEVRERRRKEVRERRRTVKTMTEIDS